MLHFSWILDDCISLAALQLPIKIQTTEYTEDYSSGRRGVTRNLVGRESAAWVQIPDPAPKQRGWIHSILFVLMWFLRLNTALLLSSNSTTFCFSQVPLERLLREWGICPNGRDQYSKANSLRICDIYLKFFAPLRRISNHYQRIYTPRFY